MSGLRNQEGATQRDKVKTDSSPYSSLTEPELSLLSFYSLLCGATSLIPIPFLDDWIFELVRRYMVRDLLAKAGYRIASSQTASLTSRPSSWEERGCLSSLGYLFVLAPLKAALYILKKIFRKIVFILSIKEATDRSVQTFHEGYLVLLGGRKARPFFATLDDNSLAALRETLRETLDETDTSPLSHIFRTVIKLNRKTLSRAGDFLLVTWRRVRSLSSPKAEARTCEAIHQEEDLLEELSRDAAHRLKEEVGHLHALEDRFTARARVRGLIPGL